ncbi:MAG: flagella basal body P-ring formation protein FlgA [Phycisphaerae bacterium]|jgi:flagella basal body P-ring formation protein FlgA
MTQHLATIIALVSLCLIPVRVYAQDTLQLRPVARLRAGQPVLLGDVATVGGPRAEQLRRIPLEGIALPMAGRPENLGITTLRPAIEAAAAKGGIDSGGLSIGGATCRLVLMEERPASEDRAATMASPEAPATQGSTVRSMILSKVAEIAGVDAAAMRVSFDQRDHALLEKATSGRTVSIHSTGSGERLGFSVRMYEQNSLVAQGDVRVGVVVRRQCAVTRTNIDRSAALNASDYQVEEQWLPLTRTPAALDQIDGCVAKGRLGAGEVIEARHLLDPVVAKAGDQIMVDCVSGGILLRTPAIATAAGRQGETIVAESVEWRRGILVKLGKPGQGVAVGPAELKKSVRRTAK